jgi:phosphoglycerate dehydrogenase-like enzyme
LPALLDGAAACLTGWRTPSLAGILRDEPSVRFVAHTAGSVRHLVPDDLHARGIRLSQAAAMIADAVAEFVIAQMLVCLRHLHTADRALHAGGWHDDPERLREGGLLGNKTVGVVGAGRVGRDVIHLLRAFGSTILVYDPMLTPEEAARLGVEIVDLDALMERSDIVTLHAPVLPQTERMISRAHVAQMRDGAIFVNAGRAILTDEDALYDALVSGRISAALDVFDKEPLPPDSRWRTVPNALITPHIAGHTRDTHLAQGGAMVEEIRHFLHGEPLRYEVTEAMLPVIA